MSINLLHKSLLDLEQELTKLKPAVHHVELNQQIIKTLKQTLPQHQKHLELIRAENIKHQQEIQALFEEKSQSLLDDKKTMLQSIEQANTTFLDAEPKLRQFIQELEDKMAVLKNNQDEFIEGIPVTLSKWLEKLASQNQSRQEEFLRNFEGVALSLLENQNQTLEHNIQQQILVLEGHIEQFATISDVAKKDVDTITQTLNVGTSNIQGGTTMIQETLSVLQKEKSKWESQQTENKIQVIEKFAKLESTIQGLTVLNDTLHKASQRQQNIILIVLALVVVQLVMNLV